MPGDGAGDTRSLAPVTIWNVVFAALLVAALLAGMMVWALRFLTSDPKTAHPDRRPGPDVLTSGVPPTFGTRARGCCSVVTHVGALGPLPTGGPG
jgi:hypothetical protein